MSETPDVDVPESPATWENVVVGKATELVGRALHDKDIVEEGDEQTEIAHEIRERYDAEHDHDR